MVSVIPVNTWVFSYDEQVIIRVVTDKDIDIIVYRDSRDYPVYKGRVSKGVSDVSIGTAQDVLNDHNLHTLIVEVVNEKTFKINAVWDDVSLENGFELNFVDENGMPSIVYGSALDMDRKVIALLDGINSVILPPLSKAFIEIYKVFDDGKKFYYVNRLDRFSAGNVYNIVVEKRDTYDVEVDYVIDYSDEFEIKVLGALLKYVDEGSNLLFQWIVNMHFNYPVSIALWLSHRIGIHLPIKSVRIEKETGRIIVRVVYEQDLSQLLVAIIAAIIAAGIVSAVVIIVEDMRTVEPVKVTISSDEYFKEKYALARDLENQCAQLYGDDYDKYMKCLHDSMQIVQDVSSPDTAMFEKSVTELKEAVNNKDKTIRNLEILVLIVLAASIMIGFMSRR